MKNKIKMNGNPFFYLFYTGFCFICIMLVFFLRKYIQTGVLDMKMTGKCLSIIISYGVTLRVYGKKCKGMVNEILGSEEAESLKALEDKRMRKKVERAVNTAIQFGARRGVKKLEKLEKKAENYDDKAAIYCMMGTISERADDRQGALQYYNRALQYRPYYAVAISKVNKYVILH